MVAFIRRCCQDVQNLDAIKVLYYPLRGSHLEYACAHAAIIFTFKLWKERNYILWDLWHLRWTEYFLLALSNLSDIRKLSSANRKWFKFLRFMIIHNILRNFWTILAIGVFLLIPKSILNLSVSSWSVTHDVAVS